MSSAALSHMADVRPTPVMLRPSRSARTCGILWRWAVGTLLCLTPVTAILAFGWLQRLTERAVLRRWYGLAGGSTRGEGFGDFMRLSPDTARLAHWPNWVRHELGRLAPAGGGHAMFSLGVAFGGLWANLRAGIAAIVNVWLLTLPPASLWILAWWGGWENSFNKGYEQHWVGPAVFVFGAALFATTMVYLPLAQARQAATGDWRSFYDFRIILALARRRWPACLGLALLFVLVSLPVMGLKILPVRLDRLIGDFGGYDRAELREVSRQISLGGTALLFALLVFLRGAVARVYAGALVEAVRDGSVTRDLLGVREQAVFERLHLFHVTLRPRRHAAIRAVAWLGSRTASSVGFALTWVIWGAFVFELVAAQFLNHAWIGWVNHPLIQLPWLWQGPI